MSLPRNPKQAAIDLDYEISKLSAEEKRKRCERRALIIGSALNNWKPKTTNMSANEQKRPFVIWMIVTMLINFVLMACAWVKTNQHQNDTAINYIILFLIFNITAARIHGKMVRNLIKQ